MINLWFWCLNYFKTVKSIEDGSLELIPQNPMGHSFLMPQKLETEDTHTHNDKFLIQNAETVFNCYYVAFLLIPVHGPE